jgi:phosphopantetheine adenylyltransferase
MRKTTLVITAFAVIASFLMLSGSMAQPITVSIASKTALNDEYYTYKKEIENFAKRIAADEEIKQYLNVLKTDQELVNKLNEIKNSDNTDDRLTLGQDIYDLLTTKDEATSVEDILTFSKQEIPKL